MIHHRGPDSVSSQFLWNFLSKKWFWYSFSLSISVNQWVSFHQYSMLVQSCI